MSDDPQDMAEALDEDVVVTTEGGDRTGDEAGESLVDYPPDRPMGVNTVGVTPVEEDAGESFAERTVREEHDPAVDALDDEPVTDSVGEPEPGQLVEPDASTVDHEAEQIAEVEPGDGGPIGPEEGAMHLEDEDAGVAWPDDDDGGVP